MVSSKKQFSKHVELIFFQNQISERFRSHLACSGPLSYCFRPFETVLCCFSFFRCHCRRDLVFVVFVIDNLPSPSLPLLSSTLSSTTLLTLSSRRCLSLEFTFKHRCSEAPFNQNCSTQAWAKAISNDTDDSDDSDNETKTNDDDSIKWGKNSNSKARIFYNFNFSRNPPKHVFEHNFKILLTVCKNRLYKTDFPIFFI